MNVRPATSADADAGSRVLRRSIAELCHQDHSGNPAVVTAWIANKTPEHWRDWLVRPDASLLVAERDGQIVGIGMVDQKGWILLNYVAPEARWTGVSTALLKAMEDASAQRGVMVCVVESTKTAKRFYIARGYAPTQGSAPAMLTKCLG